jgi:hypothetical protein
VKRTTVRELGPGDRGKAIGARHHNITLSVGSCHHDQIPDMEKARPSS